MTGLFQNKTILPHAFEAGIYVRKSAFKLVFTHKVSMYTNHTTGLNPQKRTIFHVS